MQQLTSEEIIKIQPKWLITIPKNLRAGLFEENAFVRVKKEKGRLILEPIRILDYPVRSYTDSELEEFFMLDDEQSGDLKKKGII